MIRTSAVLVLATSVSLSASALAQNPPAPNDGKREFVVSGCLLRSGYAGYKLEDAKVESIEGKPLPDSADQPVKRLKNWTLEGGGNMGPRAGEKVEVAGRTDWTDTTEAGGPAAKLPILEVKSVKTIAASCT